MAFPRSHPGSQPTAPFPPLRCALSPATRPRALPPWARPESGSPAPTSLCLLHPGKSAWPTASRPAPVHGTPLSCRPLVWWKRSRAEVWGSLAPRCVPLRTHQQPQSVLFATGGSTALSPRGFPQRMGGWNCTRGGRSGAGQTSRGPLVPSAFSRLLCRKEQTQGRGGQGPWECGGDCPWAWSWPWLVRDKAWRGGRGTEVPACAAK